MPKQVLIIEDSITDVSIMRDLLEKENIAVEVAMTGAEGVAKAKQIKPDLIILDIMLPDMNGYEVCKLIRANSDLNNSIVVVVSVKENVPDIAMAFLPREV
ncbi:MAG: response regulator [Candidatus Omnitrophica bacterium]|nr:response regulator [Candidatus Omnitrophota bacterium]